MTISTVTSMGIKEEKMMVKEWRKWRARRIGFVDHDVKLAHSCPISYLGHVWSTINTFGATPYDLSSLAKGERAGRVWRVTLNCGAANHGPPLSLNPSLKSL